MCQHCPVVICPYLCTSILSNIHIIYTYNTTHIHTQIHTCDCIQETLCLIENETVEVWQSPVELRSQLRLDAMQKVLMDMKSVEAS